VKTTALAATVLAAATLLTACGGDDSGSDAGSDTDAGAFTDQSAAEIAEAAKDAMSGLESFRIAGGLTTDGQEIQLDLALSTSGGCEGTISAGGGTVELLGVGDQTWYRPDDAFWQAQSGEQAQTLIDLVAGRWIEVGPGEADGFGQFCSPDELLEEMLDDDDEDTYEKGEVSDVDGAEAIAITNTSQESGPSVGYVQVEGEHYLLKMEREGGDEPGSISFSGFDEPVEPTAPAEEDSVSLDELGG
jgi:predicted small secreted protein